MSSTPLSNDFTLTLDLDLPGLFTRYFTAWFPLNPIKHGRMTSHDPVTGTKGCTTEKSPITSEILFKHLTVEGHVGRVGCLPGTADSTPVGCVDIDRKHYDTDDGFQKVVQDIQARCVQHGVHVYPEVSTNGGMHLWLFLTEPVGYPAMHRFLRTIVTEAGHPKVEVFPKGGAADSSWIFLPYAGAAIHPRGLGMTYLQDQDGRPIPLEELDLWVKRTPVGVVAHVISQNLVGANGGASKATLTDALPSSRSDLDGGKFDLLKEAMLRKPPEGAERHNSAWAFLNLARRMGKQQEMLEVMRSPGFMSLWFADGSRTPEQWEAELDRLVQGKSESHNREYGLTFLKEQGWELPDLSKPQVGKEQTNKRPDAIAVLRDVIMARLGKLPERKHVPTRMSALQLLAIDIDPVQFIIPGLLTEGLGMLTGRPKMGKSFMSLSLALSIAQGKAALGDSKACEHGDVLYLALEDSQTRTQDRMKIMLGTDAVDDLRLDVWWQIPRLDLGGLEALMDWLESRPRPRMIIVDVWGKFMPPCPSGRDEYTFLSEVMMLLQQVALAFHVCILLVHHTKKPGKKTGEDFLDQAMGNTAHTSNLDVLMMLDRKRDRSDAVLHVTGRDVHEQQVLLYRNEKNLRWERGAQRPDAHVSEVQMTVLLYLRHGETTIKDLKQHLKKSETAIREVLTRLHEMGLITMTKPTSGRTVIYTLSSEGEKLLGEVDQLNIPDTPVGPEVWDGVTD
ncbi:AAA family ATPase [Deinococcus roseus]|uniref:Uncharacterized protein n=1 Tax=Deinococcus roseus TaxID=392414 RepID=A0ABQ2DH06_9DEIO|nr:AAA family ATPase [Deinococcus roseus]GGJ57804.1 hypothetical protein GCM10008938_49890 [Deinococcus roseus]